MRTIPLALLLLTLTSSIGAAEPPTPAAGTPVVISAPNRDPPGVNTERLFPRYGELKPAVSFWTSVFSQYSEKQSLVHSTLNPGKVIKVLDFRADALVLDPVRLDIRRRKEEQDAKNRYETLLKRVHAQRGTPARLSGEERRLYDLFADMPGDDRYRRLADTLRVQRGLKERTDQALQISDRYLPSMEATFRGYGLPIQLTRIPLVESSFNLDAYSHAGAAGIWQFIPSSARIYMRLDNIVDDRRDPWTSTDAAARHLRDDYAMLGDWPLAVTAYNHGRGGISRALKKVDGDSLIDLIDRYDGKRFGFASKNYYAEFLAAIDIERRYREQRAAAKRLVPFEFEIVETKHYVPYETLRRLCGASDDMFRRLNPAYRPEVIEGKLYVPPGHLIRVPAGSAQGFEIAYAKLGTHERFDEQRAYFLLHKVARGDTVSEIAREYGVAQSAIFKANDLKASSTLRIGQVLKVPPKKESRPGPITLAVGESKPTQTVTEKRADDVERTSHAQAHTIRSGETVSHLAERYGVSQQAILQANDLRKTSTLRIGQILRIPPSHGGARAASYQTHTVRSGQTLDGIARRYGVSVNDLRQANQLGRSNLIRPGQQLKVPRGG